MSHKSDSLFLKCKVLHFGMSNQVSFYTVNGRALESVAEARELGVQVHGPLKVARQGEQCGDKGIWHTGIHVTSTYWYSRVTSTKIGTS